MTSQASSANGTFVVASAPAPTATTFSILAPAPGLYVSGGTVNTSAEGFVFTGGGLTTTINSPVAGSAGLTSSGPGALNLAAAALVSTVTNVANVVNPTITTSAAHGLSAGQLVTIAGIVGAVGANGTFVVVSVPTPTTFTIFLAAAPGAYTSGGTVNNFTGTTTLNGEGSAGTLILGTANTPGSASAIASGTLQLINGTLQANTAVVLPNNVLLNNSIVTIGGSSNITFTPAISFSLAGVNDVLNVTNSATTLINSTVANAITGAGILSKLGGGTLTLTGNINNNFGGQILIAAGIVNDQNPFSTVTTVGFGTGAKIVASGATLQLEGILTTAGITITQGIALVGGTPWKASSTRSASAMSSAAASRWSCPAPSSSMRGPAPPRWCRIPPPFPVQAI